MTSSWYCCDCTLGPYNLNLHTACPDCGSKRCDDCSVRPSSSDELTTMHNCSHELPAFPAAPSHMFHESTLSPPKTLSPVMDHTDLYQGPSLPCRSGAAVPGAKQHGATSMYFCCQCNDGPKTYDLQPQCIICNHHACPDCSYCGK